MPSRWHTTRRVLPRSASVTVEALGCCSKMGPSAKVRMQKSLMMAAPATCKTAIVSVEKGIALCNDPRAAELKILLIVSTPQNLLRVAKEVNGIPQINVGNYGRIAPKNGTEQRHTYTKNLYAYDEEVAILKEILATGIPCNVQTIPDDMVRCVTKLCLLLL